MLTTSTVPWLRGRRIVALLAAAVLVVSLTFAMIGNSWTANAAPEDPAEVVVDGDMIVAGPSWTFSATVKVPGPVLPGEPGDGVGEDLLGPSWG